MLGNPLAPRNASSNVRPFLGNKNSSTSMKAIRSYLPPKFKIAWRFVEQPARYGVLASSRVAIVGVSSAAISFAVAFGFIVNDLEGIPQRLPEKARTLYQATYDESPFSSKRCFTDSNGEGLTPVQIRRGEICRVGVETAGEPRFLVWGDSHAAVLPTF